MKRALLILPLLLAAPCFAQTSPARLTSFYTHEGSEKLYRAAKYAEAESMCKQAITEIEKARGNKAWELAEPLNDLATVYMRQARFAEAKQVIDRADSLLDKTKPGQAPIYARLGINKGWRLFTFGEPEQALKIFTEARQILEKTGKDSVDLAELINNQGLMFEEVGEKKEDDDMVKQARTCLLKGWQMRRALTGDESPETAESLNNLGMNLLFNGNSPEEAELGISTLKKALQLAEKVYGKNHPETAVSHGTLALALMLHHDFDESEKELAIAIPMTQRFMGDKHPDLAYELTTY
ncbi:MAG TPA: tetratricopeptide repeat protein, partial [Phycisphaerae bacterium]|nr:tetratricopeptide repeat protein [Phycisphaerae bacterium]